MRKIFGKLSAVALGAALAYVATAYAATFNLFQPANGILVGNPSTYVTTAATSSNVRSLWSGSCDSTTFLRGDGACAAASTPNAALTTAANVFTNAPQTIFTDQPRLALTEDDAAADNRRWELQVGGEALRLRILNDAGSIASNIFTVNRTDDSVDSFDLSAGAVGITGGTVNIFGGSTITLDGTTSLTTGKKLTTAATGTGNAGFNLPHGTAPSSPVNGDLWTTTAGLFARINGSTVGPYSTGGGGGSPGGSTGNVQFNDMGSFGGVTNLNYDGADGLVFGPASGDFFIYGADPSGMDADGTNLTIEAGVADGIGVGGTLVVRGGGGGTGDGTGGDASIEGGFASDNGGPGGRGIVRGGPGGENDSNGGDAFVEAGDANGAVDTGNGGNVTIAAGNCGALCDGGNVVVYAGTGAGGGSNGSITFDGLLFGNSTSTPISLFPQEGNFAAVLADGCTVDRTLNFDYEQIGNQVTIVTTGGGFADCTGDAITWTTTSPPVPTNAQPSQGALFSLGNACKDNGATVACYLSISSAGNVAFYKDTPAGVNTWTASGTRGILFGTGMQFTYTIANP